MSPQPPAAVVATTLEAAQQAAHREGAELGRLMRAHPGQS
jgi:hypothetical protein